MNGARIVSSTSFNNFTISYYHHIDEPVRIVSRYMLGFTDDLLSEGDSDCWRYQLGLQALGGRLLAYLKMASDDLDLWP